MEKELAYISTVFRNTNFYPNWIIDQAFEQVKVKLKDPMQNSNVPNPKWSHKNQWLNNSSKTRWQKVSPYDTISRKKRVDH